MTRFSLYFALAVALLSGMAALSHELLWTRRLVDLLGGSGAATSRVLGCFFLGLSLGAALSTRFVGKQRRPWRTVAILEAGIALATLPALLLPWWTQSVWPALGPEVLSNWVGDVVKLLLSLVVVLPPATVMGMVLPALGAAVFGAHATLRREGLWLYATNTLGGALGLLLASLVTLTWLGVAGSMAATAAVNVTVAVACWLFAPRATEDVLESATPAPNRLHRERKQVTSVPLPLRMALGLSLFSGAGVLATEVLAIHLVSTVVPSSLHATTGLLMAVILTLAIAALIVSWLVARFGRPERILLLALAIAGPATAASPLIFMWWTDDMVHLATHTHVGTFLASLLGNLLVVTGAGLLSAGLVLPLVFAWHGQQQGDPLGRRWGWLLAANGIGGLIGAEMANHLLMPWLGTYLGLGLIGIGYAALAVALSFRATGRFALDWRFTVTAVALAVTLLVTFTRLGELPHLSPHSGFHVHETYTGREGTVVVVDSRAKGHGIVMNNQYLLGSSKALHDERRQGLLPLMLHPQPQKVACIGLATGITAGAVLDHPDVESLTVVELSPQVTRAAAEHFGHLNGDVAEDQRAAIIVDDGRTLMAASVDRYDVIIGDLYRPWGEGEGRLYSREHFLACKSALREGGLFCQWLPMYQLTQQQFEVILATFLDVFGSADLVRGNMKSDYPLLGLVGSRSGGIEWVGLKDRCSAMRAGKRIVDHSLRHPEGVQMLFLGRASQASAATQTLNTLDNAWVETQAAQQRVVTRNDDVYLKRDNWLAFEDALRSRLAEDNPEQVPSPDETWSDLGARITKWQHGKMTRAASKEQAEQLKAELAATYIELFASLPQSMKDDPGADWSAWPAR